MRRPERPSAGDIYAGAHIHAAADVHTVAYAYSRAHIHSSTDCNTRTHSNTNSDRHAYAGAYSDTNRYPHTNTYGHAYAGAYSDTNRYPTPIPTATHTPEPTATPTDTPTPVPELTAVMPATATATPVPDGRFGFLSRPVQDGLEIYWVVSGGPMDLAGIKLGDILLEVDGRSLSGFDSEQESYDAIPDGATGTSVTFLVRRAAGGQTETIEVTRAAIPDSEYPDPGSIEAPVPTGVEYRNDFLALFDVGSEFEENGQRIKVISIDQPAGRTEWEVGAQVFEIQVQRNWAVQVVSVVPNATDMILAASRNERSTPTPPEPGKQYFMATIRAEHIGVGGGSSDTLTWEDLDAVGDATHVVYEADCGDQDTTIPDALPEVEVIRGGVVEGAVCWEIDSRDAPTLKMRFDGQVSFTIEVVNILIPQRRATERTIWYELSPSSL